MRSVVPVRLGICTVALALAVAGCSSSASTGAAQSKDSGRGSLNVITVAGPLSDPFWSAFAKGAEQADKDLGIKHEYLAAPNFNNIVPETTRALESALAKKPDALVVGDFFPDSLEPLIKKAVTQGIPVVVVNSGGASWQKLGAIGFVGEDPELVGKTAGEQMVSAGKKSGICVNTIPDNPAVVARCTGFNAAMKAGGGTAKSLNLSYDNNSNPSAIQNDLIGALKADKSVDAVYTVGVVVAGPALKAITAVNGTGRVALGTSDIGTDVLNNIKSGSMLFAVDQQPYLQGYYGSLMATQWVQYGLKPATAIVSGPLVVTKANVQQVIDSAESGVRGAS